MIYKFLQWFTLVFRLREPLPQPGDAVPQEWLLVPTPLHETRICLQEIKTWRICSGFTTQLVPSKLKADPPRIAL